MLSFKCRVKYIALLCIIYLIRQGVAGQKIGDITFCIHFSDMPGHHPTPPQNVFGSRLARFARCTHMGVWGEVLPTSHTKNIGAISNSFRVIDNRRHLFSIFLIR